MRLIRQILVPAMMLVLLSALPCFGEKVAFLAIDGDSYLLHKAIQSLDLPPRFEVAFFTHQDLQAEPAARAFVAESGLVLCDVMMSELSRYIIENDLVTSRKVFALRGSRDDEGLRQKGFVFDPDISVYFQHLSVENIRNLIRRAVNKTLDPGVDYQPVNERLQIGLYHPDAPAPFTDYKAYKNWYAARSGFDAARPWIGMTQFSSSLIEGQRDTVDEGIRRLEAAGFNVLCGFGRDEQVVRRFFLSGDGPPRIDLLLSFSLKFYSALTDGLKQALVTLDVPVFNAINVFGITTDAWRADPKGIPLMDVVWAVGNPEISGVIEPSVLTGKREVTDPATGKKLFIHEIVPENWDLLIPRLNNWAKLRRMDNRKKKVAIYYYNHSQGKQNVGASYLNVFRSLGVILNRMVKDGYVVENMDRLTEDGVKEMILRTGRNIGSWAPGELDRMLESGEVVRVSMAQYNAWFSELPTAFREKVLAQWGRPEDSDIMVKDGEFIIPAVVLGNVVMMAEPSRGWGDDPMKLYHDPTVYPHHQYIAAYLWSRHGFSADAMIHLGTHATYEWLPGKQAGLSPACPPEIMTGAVPNLYPYTMDDIGEGLQAKRRGRVVILDHLTPALKKAGLFQEYLKLFEMIQDLEKAENLGADTVDGREAEIWALAEKLGLLTDIQADGPQGDRLEALEHYLLEIRENFMPYGMHTYGVSPEADAVEDTLSCILENRPEADPAAIRNGFADSGPDEIDNLMRGLSGRYIPPGEGNDPVRNPAALPTGRNFYGFSPQKVPSPAAWKLGREAARKIIDNHLEKHGEYPRKVAVVLWATETLRNEGINESTILFLLGLKPVWDKAGRVSGTEAIPGKSLGRPRIDVLVNPSGLYRDLFPDKMLFLDNAVQKAAVLTDVENLIAANTLALKQRLVEGGMPEKEADLLSRIRIFTEKPGTYGNGVSEMTGNSGFWESDEEIVKVYENRTGFAFGLGAWGADAKELLRENLRDVDVAVHSRSSNIYGMMDNDDMFQYLGGLSLAVARESGKTPETLVTMQRRTNELGVEDVAKTVGREMRSRYLNPKWIEGMKKENYAGARAMAQFVEYMWGWQVTVPHSVDKARWDETYEVYVEDKYGMEIDEFFQKENPWAKQSISARMLEAVRKAYWEADEEKQKALAKSYAENVIRNGIACCDHTCNNPMLNQMVVGLISLPGVMTPEMVEQFKVAVEKAMAAPLEEQVERRRELQQRLTAGFDRKKDSSDADDADRKTADSPDASQKVEGYKMEDMKSTDDTTKLTSSGVQWFASLFILAVIGLFMLGLRKNGGRR